MAARRKTTNGGNVRGDLYALRDDVGNLADQVTALLSDKGDDVINEVKERVDRLRENIDGAITEAGAKGRMAIEGAKENLNDFGETLEDSIRERPFTVLAIALGVGVIVGSTLRR